MSLMSLQEVANALTKDVVDGLRRDLESRTTELADCKAKLARVEALLPDWGNRCAEYGLGNTDEAFLDSEAMENAIDELRAALADPSGDKP